MRQDYVERQILVSPVISIENAVFLASLMLRVEHSVKIMRSKEKKLKVDMVKKSLKDVVPQLVLKL
jgi:hypothetical protein